MGMGKLANLDALFRHLAWLSSGAVARCPQANAEGRSTPTRLGLNRRLAGMRGGNSATASKPVAVQIPGGGAASGRNAITVRSATCSGDTLRTSSKGIRGFRAWRPGAAAACAGLTASCTGNPQAHSAGRAYCLRIGRRRRCHDKLCLWRPSMVRALSMVTMQDRMRKHSQVFKAWK